MEVLGTWLMSQQLDSHEGLLGLLACWLVVACCGGLLVLPDLPAKPAFLNLLSRLPACLSWGLEMQSCSLARWRLGRWWLACGKTSTRVDEQVLQEVTCLSPGVLKKRSVPELFPDDCSFSCSLAGSLASQQQLAPGLRLLKKRSEPKRGGQVAL